MKIDLEGRKVLITGGAAGIGRATSLAMAQAGATVAALDHDKALLAELANEIGTGLFTQVADLSDAQATKSAVTEALDALGGVDIVVNNVGAGAVRKFEDVDDDAWHETMELNFMSYVRTIRECLPSLRRSGHAAIINNASDLGRQPEAMPIDYAASKAAVLALTKGLARYLGPSIRVNAVAPGPIWTPFWTKPGGFAETMAQAAGTTDQQLAVTEEMKKRQLPLSRLGDASEVANVIVFLASDAASFVTASVWGVDGGSIRSLI
jgi:NAD(P)-dependent dehydrogenase (short-subunit alcohol dehydrogenase family)